MKHVDRIIVSLIIAVIAIYTIPYVPSLANNMVLSFGVIVALLGALAVWRKAWFDVVLAGFILLVLFIGRMKFDVIDDTTYVFRTSAVLAYVLLHGVLLIGPWSHFTKHAQKIYTHRRHLGVTTFLLALTHASLIMQVYFNYSLKNAWTSAFVFFGFTALFIMTWLALTSWDIAQKKIKRTWWNIAHPAILVIYIALIAYVWNTALDIQTWQKTLLIAFVLVWLMCAPWSIPQKILKRVNGWKQLHVLIYVAYISVVVHVWTGVVNLQDTWLQAAFWTGFVAVVTSHALGWFLMLKEKKSHSSANIITLNGSTYVEAGPIDEFEEGRGKKIDMNGMPMAVFKYQDTFFGISAVCPHQGGPLDQGEIVDGYVECPWHRYQFSVEDGAGPPGFDDCVPYHTGITQNGVVYIATDRANACEEK